MNNPEGYIFCDYVPITLERARAQVNSIPPSTWLPTPPDPRDAYYRARKRCPVCFGTWVHQTLVGCVLNLEKPEEYKDTNRAMCEACGWAGIVHDMKPR